jgi:hypothetical protein
MCNSQPIMFIKWISDIKKSAVSMVSELPTNKNGIIPVDISNKTGFIRAIKTWYRSTQNTQYLFIVVHGIIDNNKKAIGIGKSNSYIMWDNLWDIIIKRNRVPPKIIIIGCKSSDAIKVWNRRIKYDINMPYLVGYSDIVNVRRQIRLIIRVLRILSQFTDIEQFTYLDEDIVQLSKVTTDFSYYLPIILNKVNPYFATSDEIKHNHNLTVRKYLKRRNKEWDQSHPNPI